MRRLSVVRVIGPLALALVLVGAGLPGMVLAASDANNLSPAAYAASAAGDAAAAPQGGVYVVKLGDTLADIAVAYGVSSSALMRANGITNPDVIYVGQRLVIPGRATPGGSSASSSSSTAGGSGRVYYTVQSGDTLGKIAARYGTTAAALARLNGLSSPDRIYVGMRLQVSGSGGGQTSGGGGSSSGGGATGAGTRFVVSISQQHCWVYKGSAVLYSWACSTGRKGAPTMPGSFKVQSKMSKAYGSTWNIWMPYWLGIYYAGSTENGIHGLPWNAKTGVQMWAGYVGTKITYGCVLLNNTNAKILYDMAWIGMPVIIRP